MTQHPDVRFRLRFMAGIHAPQWVKDHSGGCVLIEPDSGNGGSGCAPRFWTDAFHADYVALMQAVAARYEADPQLVEVANSECTTIFAEPFILGANSTSIDRLWQAGYTKQGHDTCLRRSTSAMMSLFPTTRVSLAGHTKWQFIVQGAGGPGDGAFAASWEDERRILNDLSSAYGSRLILDDHGLGPDDAVCPAPGQARETATSWYCYMSGLHTGTSTYGWQFTLNGGSMAVAADAGVSMGACFLEFAAFQALDADEAPSGPRQPPRQLCGPGHGPGHRPAGRPSHRATRGLTHRATRGLTHRATRGLTHRATRGLTHRATRGLTRGPAR